MWLEGRVDVHLRAEFAAQHQHECSDHCWHRSRRNYSAAPSSPSTCNSARRRLSRDAAARLACNRRRAPAPQLEGGRDVRASAFPRCVCATSAGLWCPDAIISISNHSRARSRVHVDNCILHLHVHSFGFPIGPFSGFALFIMLGPTPTCNTFTFTHVHVQICSIVTQAHTHILMVKL